MYIIYVYYNIYIYNQYIYIYIIVEYNYMTIMTIIRCFINRNSHWDGCFSGSGESRRDDSLGGRPTGAISTGGGPLRTTTSCRSRRASSAFCCETLGEYPLKMTINSGFSHKKW